MTFTQQQFFGVSITSFSSQLGWGRQPSNLTVRMVTDVRNGDSYNPPAVGTPVYFEYGSFTFGGILQSKKKESGQGGFLYEAQLVDPRELLEGVQLILDGYTGSTYSVPNLYNVYGYLEASNFGGANVNPTGIPWYLVKQAWNSLQVSTPVQFRGYNYTVDLSLLPSLPNTYRIGAKSITLSEYIEEVCQAAVADYFVTLEAGRVIKIYTISRKNPPVLGRITDFVNSLTTYHGEQHGVELRNEFTSKFIVGGPQEKIYWQSRSTAAQENDDDGLIINGKLEGNVTLDPTVLDNYYDNTIWPYWGLKENEDAIIGFGNFDSNVPIDTSREIQSAHKFEIEVDKLRYPEFPTRYLTDINEMRAAAAGQEEWELFLHLYNNVSNSVHYRKASRLALVGSLRSGLYELFAGASAEELKKRAPWLYGLHRKAEWLKVTNKLAKHEEKIGRFYEFVKNYADSYYGVKFMVNLPFILSYEEADTLRVVTSYEPNDAGFIDEDVWPTAIVNNILPARLIDFTDDENKILAYVRFDNFDEDKYDISGLDTSDYYIQGDKGQYLFVKCEVEPDIVFVDKSARTSPRAVITLPGPIKNKTPEFGGGYVGWLKALYTGRGVTEAEFNTLFSRVASESAFFKEEGLREMPKWAAVPLKSKVETYGPWYVVGAQGKVQYEQDDSLVPWNYGGFDELNTAGNAKVLESVSNQQSAETGSVTFPNVPLINLGAVLIENGPYVTDINVSIDAQGGARTTYRMQTWTPEFGRIAKSQLDRMALLSKHNRQRERENDLLGTRNAVQKIRKQAENRANAGSRRSGKGDLPSRKKRGSTHPILSADAYLGSDSGINVTVGTSPTYHANEYLGTQYQNRVVVSMDTLFRPICTSGQHPLFPFLQPTSGVTGITADSLNPFAGETDFQVMTHGNEIPDGITSIDGFTDPKRVLGLRFPLIGVGWGYDKNGKPVPNATPNDPSDSFATNYKTRSDLWKAGPVDIRWDDTRKLWKASGSEMRLGVPSGTIANNATGTVFLYGDGGATGDSVEVKNISGIALSGVLVKVDDVSNYEKPLISLYAFGDCS